MSVIRQLILTSQEPSARLDARALKEGKQTLMFIFGWMHWLLVMICHSYQTYSMEHEGLSNKHLKVAAGPWRPFLMWKCPNHTKWSGWGSEFEKECPNKEDKLFSGVLWELLSFMQQARNCTFSLVKSVDSLWGGECYNSNNCTGMIGMANRKEVDFALGKYITILHSTNTFECKDILVSFRSIWSESQQIKSCRFFYSNNI